MRRRCVLGWHVEWSAFTIFLLGAVTAFGQGSVSGIQPVNKLIETPSFDQPANGEVETGVSFIDSALPLSRVQARFEGAYGYYRPTRAEYFWPTTGPFSGRGPALPETRVDYVDISSYLELAWVPRHFSTFLEIPHRWLNPEINRNLDGFGDLNGGVKWAFWSTPDLMTTLQVRLYGPTASDRSLGTRHFSVEPAFLLNVRPLEVLTLEGEFRYWVPVGGTGFDGDMLRYGLGLVYGVRESDDIWLTPVAECVGWTVLNGQAVAAQSPTTFWLEDSAGDTIINVSLGLRIGYGNHMDVYGGYGRPVTGAAWHRDIWRLECRFFF